MKKAGTIFGTVIAYVGLAIYPMIMLAIFSHQLHHTVLKWLGIILSTTYSTALFVELKTKKKFRTGTNWK